MNNIFVYKQEKFEQETCFKIYHSKTISDHKKYINQSSLPTISPIMKNTHNALAINSFLRAFLSTSSLLSLWQ